MNQKEPKRGTITIVTILPRLTTGVHMPDVEENKLRGIRTHGKQTIRKWQKKTTKEKAQKKQNVETGTMSDIGSAVSAALRAIVAYQV